MNRREAILAAAGGVVTGGFVVGDDHKPLFKTIDSRLSYKIYLNDLQNGECGWIAGGPILLSKKDQIPYFCTGGSYLTLQSEEPQDPNYSIHVGRHNDQYYVTPTNEHWDLIHKLTPDNQLQPAMLAYLMGYPLEKPSHTFTSNDGKKKKVFTIPCDWVKCAEHPTVMNNIHLLRAATVMMKQLRDEFGFLHCTPSQYPTPDNYLDKVLLMPEKDVYGKPA